MLPKAEYSRDLQANRVYRDGSDLAFPHQTGEVFEGAVECPLGVVGETAGR